MNWIKQNRKNEPFLRSVQRLALQLPLLGALLSLSLLCAAAFAIADDVTVAFSTVRGGMPLIALEPIRMVAIVWIKAGVMLQQVTDLVGF